MRPAVTARLKLLAALDSGILDGLECPDCHAAAVSIQFSRPAPREYRTWFLCGKCTFTLRLQNSARPKHYSDGRIDLERQAQDRELLPKRKAART